MRTDVRLRRRWHVAGRPWLVAPIVLLVLIAAVAFALVTSPQQVQRTDSGDAAGSPGGAAPASAAAGGSSGTRGSAGPTPHASGIGTLGARPKPASGPGAQTLRGWPNASNTGVPAGVALHSCATTISRPGTYDACRFNGDVTVKASHVKITRSMINGSVDAGSGAPGEQSGLVISDSTIDCHCMADDSHTPAAISESNYTLLRVNVFNAGHGASVKSNVTIQDSYIHGLGANTEAHKDGIYSGDGSHVVIRHNNIECNDGPAGGCTSAIGLLTDFGDITDYTIDHNLLNTNGSYCFYGSGGPQKDFSTSHIVFTNNHFGRTDNAKCGFYGPVTYFDVNAAGMVWSGNVWDDTGAAVSASY